MLGLTTNFYLDGSKILAQETAGRMLHFNYGMDGVIGFTYDSSEYFYKKNIQGDVIGILNANGVEIVKYVYDAWGNHEILFSEDNIAEINPFRYRGYYYDVESGLYYLQSRYYDPETGRFINADAIAILDEGKDHINGLNLFVYCLNNPVMMTDETGAWPKWLTKILIGVAVIIVLGVASAFTGGAAGVILGAAFAGALSGAIGGVALGAVTGIVVGIATGDWSGMMDSIASGFMTGVIGGAVSGALLAGINVGIGALTHGAKGVQIIGSAQKTGTFFHRMASNVQAGKMAMQIGRYSTISLNSKLKTVGLKGGALRPDVVGIARFGSSKIIEVTSASQTAAQMIAKCKRIVAINPGLTYNVVNWAGWIGRIFF